MQLSYQDLSEEQVTQVRGMFDQFLSNLPFFYTYETGITGNVISRKSIPLEILRLPDSTRLDSIVAYEGGARFIGVWWVQDGDELGVSDGYTTAVGTHPHADFLTFARTHSIWQYQIGDSDTEAYNYLVFDRTLCITYLMPAETGKTVLTGQWKATGFPSTSSLPKEAQERLKHFIEHYSPWSTK